MRNPSALADALTRDGIATWNIVTDKSESLARGGPARSKTGERRPITSEVSAPAILST